MKRQNRRSVRIRPLRGFAAALCCSTLPAVAVPGAFALEAWPVDALVKVLHDFTKPAKPEEKVYVAMARGETEAGQVAFRASSACEVSAEVAPLRSDSGAVIPKVKAQFLNYHTVPKPQWPAGAATEFIKHPDEFPIVVPDAFRPEPTAPVEAGQTKGLWLIVETAVDTAPGIYRGSVTVKAEGQAAAVPVEVKVYEAVAPAKRSLKIYNWLFMDARERGWNNPVGGPDWGESDWAMLEQVAANMVAHRQNMFTVPVIHNVLSGPEVHTVRIIWKNAGNYNLAALKKTMQAVAARDGKNLFSGRDALEDRDAREAAAALAAIGNELSDSKEDAEEVLALLGACAEQINKARSDAKYAMDTTPFKALMPFLDRLGILAHGLTGRRAPDAAADPRNVFERECEFDFSRFDRAAEIFLKHDPDAVLVGGWLALFGTAGKEIIPGEKHRFLRTPAIPIFNRKGEIFELLPQMESGDEVYLALVTTVMKAVMAHVKEKGWSRNFMMSLCDETFPNRSMARVMVANAIRKAAPDIRFVDAIRDTAGAVGSVDFWIPLPSHLEAYIDFFRSRQQAGEEVGYYTCVTPGGYNMNRFADFPLIKTRLLHWHNFRFGTTRFLHWGYNARFPAPDVEEMHGNGDFNLVYKDAAGNVVSSIRQAAQRDGIEDYELLKLVEAKDADAAQKLCAAIVTDCREYTRNEARFREVRELLLEAAGAGDIAPALRQKIMELKPDHFTLLKDMPKGAPLDESGWELVYECDSFKPDALGTDWIVTSGQWAIEDGLLKKLDRSDGHVFFARPLGRDQKLEFTAWSDLPYPNDLTGLLCAELKKETKKVQGHDTEVWTGGYGSAYFFGFGCEGNAFSKFMVRGVEMRTMPKTIVPRKKHHIVCRREGMRVTHVIDGEVLLDAESKDLLDSPENAYAGFYFFENAAVRGVKIYAKRKR